MKTVLYISFILFTSISLAQTKRIPVDNEKVKKKSYHKEIEVRVLSETNMVFGDFEVNSYEAMSRKTLVKNELDKLIGTLIRIKETDITGDEIDPITIENLGIEKMDREDYVFRTFGADHSCEDCKLPQLIQVYKTGRLDCYGIVILSNKKIALPYKGSMLYLDLK